jgi:NAD(P)-dependent dehydrogenase (short-subunit alcohol dehydrogenase family)
MRLLKTALGGMSALKIFSRGGLSNSALASSSYSSYTSISVPPGTMPVEEQPCLTPLNSDSTVLVIGASRGLGLEFAKQLKEKGCRVIGTVRSGDGVYEGSGGLQGTTLLKCDVGDEESIKNAAHSYKNAKLPAITHIIYNAGVYGPRAPFGEVKAQDMLEVFKINTIGPLLVAQYFIPLMGNGNGKTKHKPVLGILSSKVGSVDDNGSGGSYAYRASKSALNICAKSLSIDLQDNIKVVLLHPGYVRTDMTGGNGLIDPHESVTGMLRAIEATDDSTAFRWVDYKACLIPW